MFGIKRTVELKVGDQAPDFRGLASDGSMVHLGSLLGQGSVLIFFYPKDFTPGCTQEACGLRDDFAAYRALNTTVFGISYDSVAAHRKFVDKYRLPFQLISDPDHSIAKSYGANGLLAAKRMSFVVGTAGKIIWIDRSVNASRHSQELLKVLSKP